MCEKWRCHPIPSTLLWESTSIKFANSALYMNLFRNSGIIIASFTRVLILLNRTRFSLVTVSCKACYCFLQCSEALFLTLMVNWCPQGKTGIFNEIFSRLLHSYFFILWKFNVIFIFYFWFLLFDINKKGIRKDISIAYKSCKLKPALYTILSSPKIDPFIVEALLHKTVFTSMSLAL